MSQPESQKVSSGLKQTTGKNLEGLIMSGHRRAYDSAYGLRISKLAEGLEKNAIRCDYFFLPDNKPLDIQTTIPIVMPFWLKMLRKYDFIYCGAPMVGQALFFCRMFLRGLFILDMHGDDIAQSSHANEVLSQGKRRSASLRVILQYRMAMSAADYWLTQSSLQMEDLIRDGIPANRVSVVRNGVDLELFRFTPQPKEPKFTFGYAGEFQVWQGIPELLDAFEAIGEPSVRMLMVGFREGDQQIKQDIKQRFGSRVELVDRVDHPSMIKLLESVAILVTPGLPLPRRAAFPTKFAEYAALGRPILVSDVDETVHFVRKHHCGFVSGPHPTDLARTLSEASRVPFDQLVEMGTRARKMAEEHFSWERIGIQYAGLIREIISKVHRKSP